MQKAAVVTALNRVELHDLDRPVPAPGEALLRVEKVGVCGTDLHVFDGSYPTPLPVVLGHEISAIVEELPADGETTLRVGDRVAVEPVTSCGTCIACRRGRRNACRAMVAVGLHRPGGLQQHLTAPLANCHPTGDLPAEVAALAETMSVSLRAVTRPRVDSDDHVVVLGAGPIGLGAVIAARDIGAEVMVLDLQESRRALARELGAAETVAHLAELPEQVQRWTDGEGATVVIEATGVPAVAEAAYDIAAPAGRISMVGVSERSMTISMRPITRKELDVYGSKATLDFPAAVALARRQRDAVAKLISHRFPLAEAEHALRFALEHPEQVVKALIEVD